MTPRNFERAIRSLAARRPFRAFVIELVSGERFAVDHPEALAIRGGIAVFITPKGPVHLFESDSVSRLIDTKNGAAG
jgi:hypothetical protein